MLVVGGGVVEAGVVVDAAVELDVDDACSPDVVVGVVVEFSGTVGDDDNPLTLQVSATAAPNITSALINGTRLMRQPR